MVCGTGSGRVTTYVAARHQRQRGDDRARHEPPAPAAGRRPGRRTRSTDGGGTSIATAAEWHAGSSGTDVEGLGRLREPATDLDGRLAEHLADLARVQLAEVAQHDGDARALVEPAQAVGEPLEQGELVLELLGQHAAGGHRLTLATAGWSRARAPRSRTQPSRTMRASSTSTSPSRRSRPQSGSIRANAATARSSARSGRHAEHDEHPDDRAPSARRRTP